MVEAKTATQIAHLRSSLSTKVDKRLGEIAEFWREKRYKVPSVIIERWQNKPFSEIVPTGLKYSVTIYSMKVEDEEGGIEVRRIHLKSTYAGHRSIEDKWIKWEWVLNLHENPTIEACQRDYRFANQERNGSLADSTTREATLEDLKVFEVLL